MEEKKGYLEWHGHRWVGKLINKREKWPTRGLTTYETRLTQD